MKQIEDMYICSKRLSGMLGECRSPELLNMVVKFAKDYCHWSEKDTGKIYMNDKLMGVYEVESKDLEPFLKAWLDDWIDSTENDYMDPDEGFGCHVEIDNGHGYAWRLSLRAEGASEEILEALWGVDPMDNSVWPPKGDKDKP